MIGSFGPGIEMKIVEIPIRGSGQKLGAGMTFWGENAPIPSARIPIIGPDGNHIGFLVIRRTGETRLFRGEFLRRYEVVDILHPEDASELPKICLAATAVEPSDFALKGKNRASGL